MNRFLVTGGAGFIGSHLAERLLADGAAVEVLDDLSSRRRENLSAVSGVAGFRFTEGSVCDEALTLECIGRAEAVFHLAAGVGVQRLVDRPVETIRTNVLGSEIVLRHAAAGGKRVLLTSSSEVYGKSEAVPFREEDDCVLGPPQASRWSYAASKVVAETLAMAYHRREGAAVIVARLFNTIGPRQRGLYGMVVPRFVAAALAGEPLRIFGDGRQTRCFCHVADTVDALVRLMSAQEAAGGVFNVGSTEEVSIEHLAERIIRMTGGGSSKQFVPYERAYGRPMEDMARRVPDVARLCGLTGWRARHDLTATLGEVIEAMRERAEGPEV
jgi:UDP-glucose 4-epimerase